MLEATVEVDIIIQVSFYVGRLGLVIWKALQRIKEPSSKCLRTNIVWLGFSFE
jgi:hypothetical protein